MRIARFSVDNRTVYAAQSAEQWLVIDDPFSSGGMTLGDAVPVDAEMLPSAAPVALLGMAHNSGSADRELPPQAFHKSAHTVVGSGAGIVADPVAGQLKAEGELAVIIGKTARHLTTEDARAHVLGYTVANDVTAVEQIPRDSLFTQVKNGDGFTPLGAWIETEFDPDNALITVLVDGVVREQCSTAALARGIDEILVYLSRWITLHPGDVILTGCPGTITPINPGDTVTVRIDGIGEISNPVSKIGQPLS